MKKDTRPSLRALLRTGHACLASRRWVAKRLRDGATIADLWDTCPKGDWLMWLVDEAFGSASDDPRAKAALEAWCRGSNDLEDAKFVRAAISRDDIERALVARIATRTVSP